MPAGKYVMPIVMGEASREVFLIKVEMAKSEEVFLLRHVKTRAVLHKDEKHITRLMENNRRAERPVRIMELEIISEANKGSIEPHEACLIHGYITNLLPGAFKAPELNDWFILEKPSELTSLKMARFAINLLDCGSRTRLLSFLHSRNKVDTAKYSKYK